MNKFVDDARRGDKAKCAGHKAGAAKSGVAVQTQLRSGIPFVRAGDGFFGQDALDSEWLISAGKTVAHTKLFPDFLKESIMT